MPSKAGRRPAYSPVQPCVETIWARSAMVPGRRVAGTTVPGRRAWAVVASVVASCSEVEAVPPAAAAAAALERVAWRVEIYGQGVGVGVGA